MLCMACVKSVLSRLLLAPQVGCILPYPVLHSLTLLHFKLEDSNGTRLSISNNDGNNNSHSDDNNNINNTITAIIMHTF